MEVPIKLEEVDADRLHGMYSLLVEFGRLPVTYA